jgi:hypothetical protein
MQRRLEAEVETSTHHRGERVIGFFFSEMREASEPRERFAYERDRGERMCAWVQGRQLPSTAPKPTELSLSFVDTSQPTKFNHIFRQLNLADKSYFSFIGFCLTQSMKSFNFPVVIHPILFLREPLMVLLCMGLTTYSRCAPRCFQGKPPRLLGTR